MNKLNLQKTNALLWSTEVAEKGANCVAEVFLHTGHVCHVYDALVGT